MAVQDRTQLRATPTFSQSAWGPKSCLETRALIWRQVWAPRPLPMLTGWIYLGVPCECLEALRHCLLGVTGNPALWETAKGDFVWMSTHRKWYTPFNILIRMSEVLVPLTLDPQCTGELCNDRHRWKEFVQGLSTDGSQAPPDVRWTIKVRAPTNFWIKETMMICCRIFLFTQEEQLDVGWQLVMKMVAFTPVLWTPTCNQVL